MRKTLLWGDGLQTPAGRDGYAQGSKLLVRAVSSVARRVRQIRSRPGLSRGELLILVGALVVVRLRLLRLLLAFLLLAFPLSAFLWHLVLLRRSRLRVTRAGRIYALAVWFATQEGWAGLIVSVAVALMCGYAWWVRTGGTDRAEY